ncbi:MAG TPA: hypothetical protein PLM81_11415 [Ginsengibacter sp.]|nr:hypothetical protein [Ginsengibacter sp.]HRP17922.1 hypothetical protein [Ginsengibacter sp.]HRP45425.1 hypothetical protein [Ginsengibacter sp.]
MKRFNKILFRVTTALLFITFSPTMSFAQGDPPPDGGCDPLETWEQCCARNPAASACPIDGGVVALLAVGVGYGIKRARDSRQKSEKALGE